MIEVYVRLLKSQWKVDFPREVIRLGLIGGGMSPPDAHLLMTRYYDPSGKAKVEHVQPAIAILGAALMGVPDDDVAPTAGKATPAGENAKTGNGPDGASITEPAQPWDSDLEKSTDGVSGSSLQ